MKFTKLILLSFIVLLFGLGLDMCFLNSGQSSLMGMVKIARAESNFEAIKQKAISAGACSPTDSWTGEDKVVVSCPPDSDEKAYRLQVKIPGVGRTCYYPGPSNVVGQWELKACHYMPGTMDLRHWIKGVYKFLVGLALGLAVLMIMVGGLQRIIAGGSSQRVSGSNATILAAISGGVLALGSYILLYTLDIRLVEFEKLNVEPVKGQIQSGRWCINMGSGVWDDKEMPKYKFKEKKSTSLIKASGTLCGKEYSPWINTNGTYKDYGNSNNMCLGSLCANGNICTELEGVGNPFCVDPEKMCNSLGAAECSSLNDPLRILGQANLGLLSKSCARFDVTQWCAYCPNDSCKFGEILLCPQGYTKVSCGSGATEGICWQFETQDEKKIRVPKTIGGNPFLGILKSIVNIFSPIVGTYVEDIQACSDDPYANTHQGICCKAVDPEEDRTRIEQKNIYRFVHSGLDDDNLERGKWTRSCEKIEKCEHYINMTDACIRNLCTPEDAPCEWVKGGMFGGCVSKKTP